MEDGTPLDHKKEAIKLSVPTSQVKWIWSLVNLMFLFLSLIIFIQKRKKKKKFNRGAGRLSEETVKRLSIKCSIDIIIAHD